MKPYIVCYMMMSVDGRIDCGMTAQLQGVNEYYQILRELDLPSTLSGRRTAELEMALPGKFSAENSASYDKEGFSKKISAEGYSIIVDTHGSLLWEKEKNPEKPRLIITSAQVSKAYLEYLDGQNISWIACGDNHIDLARAAEILNEEFGVERMGVVGGPGINTGFLNAGLLDEIDILIGPGIDGRAEMPSVFEGRDNPEPLPLKLKNVKPYNDGTVLLAYSI